MNNKLYAFLEPDDLIQDGHAWWENAHDLRFPERTVGEELFSRRPVKD